MTTNKNNTGSMAAGIAGAAIGAAATAAIITLSDKDKRKKVEQAIGDIKTKSVDQLNTLKSQASKVHKTVEKTAADVQADIKEDVSEGISEIKAEENKTTIRGTSIKN